MSAQSPESAVRTVAPNLIDRNPENPRLIFREAELTELQESIRTQGILVPLTVFERKGSGRLTILDGERRWRCALKLGLARVPVIVQPEPTQMANIMMMFAIHNARAEWEPLPTAYKLAKLEGLFHAVEGRDPTEAELAQLASLTRGEVRRLKKLLGLPQRYLDDLLAEAEKPRQQQDLTVDQVLEATNAARALRKRGVVGDIGEEDLRAALVDKFKEGVTKSTVDPRKLARLARAVERDEVPLAAAKRVVKRLVDEPGYTVDQAFKDSVEWVDYQHGVEQLCSRVLEKLSRVEDAEGLSPSLEHSLRELQRAIRRVLSR